VRRVFVGGALTSVAAIIAAWVTFGVSGTPDTTTCPLPAYPDATCTGVPAGTTLTVIDELDYIVNTAGRVVDGVDVRGCIDVRAPGVTIKNSKMECVTTQFSSAAENAANPPLTVQDSEIDCKTNTGGVTTTGVAYRNIRVYRADIHGCENGLDMDRDDILQDSYVHDLAQCTIPGCPEPSPHTDGIQSGSAGDLIIQHNTIYGMNLPCTPGTTGTPCNGTSAVNINNNPANTFPIHDVLIKDNLLAGGAFTLYCPRTASTNFQIARNHFSQVYKSTIGEFGPSSDCSDETQTGNVIHETGAPVSLG
jgi:hypothetical protein